MERNRINTSGMATKNGDIAAFLHGYVHFRIPKKAEPAILSHPQISGQHTQNFVNVIKFSELSIQGQEKAENLQQVLQSACLYYRREEELSIRQFASDGAEKTSFTNLKDWEKIRTRKLHKKYIFSLPIELSSDIPFDTNKHLCFMWNVMFKQEKIQMLLMNQLT